MEIQDDRTDAQKLTHTWLVVGTDKFMSGWGKATGGNSYAAWACLPEHSRIVRNWVESRGDMRRVREVSGNYLPSGRGHLHIYVADENHPSLAYLKQRN